MYTPIDTDERRAAVHASPEVAALKRLARTHGLSMRRHRRLGKVSFDVGLGGTRRATYACFGEITFTDTGRLDTADLFGSAYAREGRKRLTVSKLATVFEFGTATPEEVVPTETSSIMVLDMLPEARADALTGPLALPELAPVHSLEVAVFDAQPTAELVASVDTQTLSIPIPLTITVPWPPKPVPVVEDKPEFPSARQVWTQFAFGMAFIVQLMFSGSAAAIGRIDPVLMSMSVAAAMIGVVMVKQAVRVNDERIEAFKNGALA